MLKRRFYIYMRACVYIYMRHTVLQKTGLLWLSYVKLVLIFKAIHKQSFAPLLYATPPFLALADFLPPLLSAHLLGLTHLPGAAFILELQDYKTCLIIQRQQEVATAVFLLCPPPLLWDPMLLICYCPECTGSSFSRWHKTIQTHHQIHLATYCSFSPAIWWCLSTFLGRNYFSHFLQKNYKPALVVAFEYCHM